MATNPPQITEYTIATFSHDSSGQINVEAVNALIQQGWQPFGGVSHVKRGPHQIVQYTQAMVRYKT